jgi:peroxiredoxin
MKARYPDVWPINQPGYSSAMTDGARRPELAGGDAVPGDPAPAFSSPSSTGRTLSLDDFLGLVPLAMTFLGTLPKRAADDMISALNDVFPEFGRHRVQLLIVTPDGPEVAERRRRNGTTVPLLADEDGQLLERFASSATFPATVVIDEAGTVTRVLEGGDARNHAAAVLTATTHSIDEEVGK